MGEGTGVGARVGNNVGELEGKGLGALEDMLGDKEPTVVGDSDGPSDGDVVGMLLA